MRKALIALAVLAVPALAEDKPAALSPPEIVAAAPKGDWTAIAGSDLLVMDLAPDGKGRPRRVVIQLGIENPSSPGWISNIRKLALAHWWDGLSINRVQDNYVVQWGDGSEKKALPAGLSAVPESMYYVSDQQGIAEASVVAAVNNPFAKNHGLVVLPSDSYALKSFFWGAFPYAGDEHAVWRVHCYGMVGVGRDMPPNTGSGAELYVVIGHAPRHLDRNIALVGRVIEGIEHLSSLPRGKGALGFYDLAQGDERVPIVSVRIGSEVKDLPAYEYLSTGSASFARYADARANRRDAFFIRPAGGADICNIPVPVRRVQR